MDSFFGIGPLELMFILIFALIFLGPERLPRVIREGALYLRKMRALTQEITQQLNDEFGDLQELDPRHQINQIMNEELNLETDPDKIKAKKEAKRAEKEKKKTASNQPAAKPAQQKSTAPEPVAEKTTQASSTEEAAADDQAVTDTAASDGESETETEAAEREDGQAQPEMDATKDEPSGENDSQPPAIKQKSETARQISPASADFAGKAAAKDVEEKKTEADKAVSAEQSETQRSVPGTVARSNDTLSASGSGEAKTEETEEIEQTIAPPSAQDGDAQPPDKRSSQTDESVADEDTSAEVNPTPAEEAESARGQQPTENSQVEASRTTQSETSEAHAAENGQASNRSENRVEKKVTSAEEEA